MFLVAYKNYHRETILWSRRDKILVDVVFEVP